MVKKFIKWMSLSNRYKHLLLGIAIGLVSTDAYCAALAGTLTAGSMEVKDELWGGKFDWIDFTITLVGVVIGFLIHIALWKMFSR